MEKNNSIIKFHNLCKSYDQFKLNRISFNVGKGEVVGLIGANGAGKSTTIKSILKIINADSGEITFLGNNILEDSRPNYKEDIGYVGEDVDFFSNQKLCNIKKFYEIHYNSWDDETYRYLCEDVFELNNETKIKELSKGMKVKFSLSLALSHRPKLLIMDEPTSGLDPIVRRKILEILKDYSKNYDAGILFSSHITEDMKKIADKLVFLDKGELLKECSMEYIKKNNIDIDEYLELLIHNRGEDNEKNIL